MQKAPTSVMRLQFAVKLLVHHFQSHLLSHVLHHLCCSASEDNLRRHHCIGLSLNGAHHQQSSQGVATKLSESAANQFNRRVTSRSGISPLEAPTHKSCKLGMSGG